MNVLPVGLVIPNALVQPLPLVRLPGWALLALRLRLTSGVRTGESGRPCGWLGRVRVGEDCLLRLLTVGAPGVGLGRSGVTWPDAVPVARIYSDVAGPAAQLVPVDDTAGGAIGTFRGRYTPGAVNPPGRYFALYGYTVGGRSRSVVAPFEVIAGGHPSSHVLAMFHFNLPAGHVFIAHQRSGRVTTGLRPYLDPGD